MSFVPTYHKRNLASIAELGDKTQVQVMKFYRYCVAEGVDILIYEAKRTLAEQKANVAKGASETMKSYHLVGQAIDFVPVVNGKADWGAYGTSGIQKVLHYAQTECNLVWGGTWKTLVDKPHLQYSAIGYDKDTFSGKAVPFEVPVNVSKPVSTPKPVAKPASGIKAVGKIKIAHLKHFTYIYEKPSNTSKAVGQAPLGHIYDISGSTSDFYEIIYQGKRAYVSVKYASRI